MPDAKKPVDALLDLAVYAPLGLLLNLDEVVPQLVEKGRQQVVMARTFGRFAVAKGGAEVTSRTTGVQEKAATLVGHLSGRSDTGHDTDPPSPTTPSTAPVTDAPTPMKPVVVSPTGPTMAAPVEEIIPVTIEPDDGPVGLVEDELAVPGYDSLSASQVVPRLAGLSTDELESVRRYEAAHRGRKTILSKIDQLQR